jgi:SAM-dependent methyltransferase
VQPEDYSDSRVLDAGCGTGEYACWFASQGAEVVGLDLSSESLEQARHYADEYNLDGARFVEGSVLDLPFDSESFDLVYCTGVLHHTPAPFRGFRELCRVTRPGGKVLVSLYNSWGFLPRSLRWNIARLLGGADLDRRVDWGRRLFPFTSKKLVNDDLEDPETLLYDYFAAPRQSTHSVSEVLRWFDRVGLDFHGSFPPVRPTNYPALFRHEAYESIEDELKSPLYRLVARVGNLEMSRDRPASLERFLSELMWLFAGVDIFSMGGTKPE